MERKQYSGWTNYETWNCKLWLDNDEGSQELQQDFLKSAQHTKKVSVWTDEENVKFNLADLLKDYIEENNPLADSATMYSDIMTAALQEIDWNEIAQSIIDDNEEVS